jgi:hypothetical protein
LLGEYFADLVVESELLVELKACKALANEHTAQLLGYLKSARRHHGLPSTSAATDFRSRSTCSEWVGHEGTPASARAYGWQARSSKRISLRSMCSFVAKTAFPLRPLRTWREETCLPAIGPAMAGAFCAFGGDSFPGPKRGFGKSRAAPPPDPRQSRR